ncbi:MAG: beta-lactamase family protein, partial [Acidobacteria bacterium]|nr:beta-lactamase family protein [Acidobacteriota bacterium]
MIRSATTRPVAAVMLSAVLLLIPAATRADELSDKIDAIMAEAYPGDGPGAAVIAVRDGKVLYRGAHGLADLESGVPLTAESVFRLGSITKQFTSAAILLLVERGELSLSDPLTKFLPDYPTHGHTITVENLLTHTSGIFNYTSIPGYMQTKIRAHLSTEELVNAFKDHEINFAPGEQWSYSNSGYVLLGAIIEKVSGQSYEEFVQRNIFDVLGMHGSYYGSHTRIIPNRAHGYGGAPGNWSNSAFLSMTQPHAAGSLLSTVDDMARWDAALYTDELLKPETIQAISELIVAEGHRLVPAAAEQTRADSFVMQSNIHHPTESTLIRDGVRKIIELCVTLAETHALEGWRQHAHLWKRIKRASRAIERIAAKKGPHYQRRLQRAYRKLLGHSRRIVQRARALCNELAMPAATQEDVFAEHALQAFIARS